MCLGSDISNSSCVGDMFYFYCSRFPAIALVLLQASLHSCRSYNKATLKNDTAASQPLKLPPQFIQILESLDSPDAKITKIKDLIPVYNEFPEFRVKSNKKHLFMPYKKKGKPLAYILKKAYVNEIVSEHTVESFESFEDAGNNERMYKGKPTSYRNKEKKPEKYRKYNYSHIPEIHILVDGDVADEPEINDYDEYGKNRPEVEKSAELIDDLEEPIILLPAEHRHIYHTHRHNNGNSEEKAEVASNSVKNSAVVTVAKHGESKHHHHGFNSKNLQLFQSDVKSDDAVSNREQIHQKLTEDKPIGSIPKGGKIEKELDQIQAINVHKHHHHSEPDVFIAALTSTDDNHLLDIVNTKHGHHKINLGEENVSPKDDLILHMVAHHTEDPYHLEKIDADELHSDKSDADSDFKHKHEKSDLELNTNATEQNSGKKKHPHSHGHSSHHHSYHKESVTDFDKYISYLTDLNSASPNTNNENNLNLSNDTVIEVILNEANSVSQENNDNNASDSNRIVVGNTELMKNQVALSDGKLDSHISDFSASAYYTDEFGSGKGDASGSETSSEFLSSVSDSNQESTETEENSSIASTESENTSIYSNELETNESNSYSESNSAFNSNSLELDLPLLPSSQSESGPESNESDISGSEELPSEASNLISESFILSSELDSTNLSDESNPSQSNESNDSSVSFESQSAELSNSRSLRSSEIGLNSILGSDNSDSASENDSKSYISLSSGSGYLSQSESEESSQSDLAGENISKVSKESLIESKENQLNSTVILAPTILSGSISIVSASGSNSQESYLDPNPTDINLASEVSYSSLNTNATSSESSTSNQETVFSSESNSSNVESNTFSIDNSAHLETTALNSSSIATEESIGSNLVTASIAETPVSDLESTALKRSSVATEESIGSNLVIASIVETPVLDLESIASSLMSSASSLKSVASSLEASAFSLSSVPGLECIASKLNTTASELVYDAINLETSAISLKWGSGLSTALKLMTSTESIVKPDLSTESSAISASHTESKTSNLESIPSFESISQIIEKSPSSPHFKSFYSTIQSSSNNNVHRAEKKDLSKEIPVIENRISNGQKTYSMSFVFNK